MTTCETRPTGSLRIESIANVSLAVLEMGIAHEFSGHLYEAVGRIADRFAHNPQPGALDHRLPSLRSPGSPLRYFAPVAPLTMAAALTALATSRRIPGGRSWIATAVAALTASDVLTAYIVRALNARLFVAGHQLTPDEQHTLLRRWYRLNAARIVLCGGAWTAAAIARRTRRNP